MRPPSFKMADVKFKYIIFEIRISETIYYIKLNISVLCESVHEISKHKVFLFWMAVILNIA